MKIKNRYMWEYNVQGENFFQYLCSKKSYKIFILSQYYATK